MRILLIHQYFLEKDDGGGSRFNTMTEAWESSGHEITVLAGMVHYATGKKRPKYIGKYTNVEQYSNGIEVIRSHVSSAYNINFIGRLWAYFSFVFSSIYSGIFKAKGKYDIIIVTSPPLFVGITALVLSWFKRCPFVFEVRDLWPESAIDTGVLSNGLIIKLAYWFEKLMYRKAALINVLTPAFRDKLINEKEVPKEKVIFIPNAADFIISEELLKDFDFRSFRTELGWDDKFIITYVGAHGVANHLIQLIDAADELQDTKAHFVLIGAGMKRQELINEVERRSLKNIEFINSVPKQEVFKYILASNMGASVLKKVDTFKTIYSNKTFDYMACQRPVFLMIDGVSRELVEEADCGVYVEPENISECVAVVKKLITFPERDLEKMGRNGYNFAKEHFDRSKLANQYMDYLIQLIKA